MSDASNSAPDVDPTESEDRPGSPQAEKSTDDGSAVSTPSEAASDGGDDEHDTESAWKRVTDPDHARRLADIGYERDAAVAALRGGGYANVFLGQTTVETIVAGNHHGGAPPRGAMTDVVPSGPVSTAILDRIRSFFVHPDGYGDMRLRLNKQWLVLLRARTGTGRTTAALHLLDEECREGVRKLDPDVELKTVGLDDLESNNGYLLESLEPRQAAALRAYHVEQLATRLGERGCRLVVIVDDAAPLRLDEVGQYLVDGIGLVESEALVRKHLGCGLRKAGHDGDGTALLEQREVRELLAEIPPDTPLREQANLGTLLVEVVQGRAELLTVQDQYRAVASAEFEKWFDEQADAEQRSFVIALAVFNGMPVQVVSVAARMLADRIKAVEVPRRLDRARSLFATPLRKRLADARAEVVQSTQETPHGQVAVQVVRFRDERFPRRVLEHVCQQYDQVHDLVRKWLLNLGADPDQRVKMRAGVAVGLLSLFEFERTRSLVILPWADSGDEDARDAAIAALQIPSQQPEFTPVITRMLTDWIKQNNEPWRRVTAVRALGSTGAMMPDLALRLLRRAARRADWKLATAIAASMAELFQRRELTGTVLDTLVQWTGEDEFPVRRETGLLSVLHLSYYLVVEPSQAAGTWPVLVWLADAEPAYHDRILTLLARMLDASGFIQPGYRELRRWVVVAQKETSLREPLARMFLKLAAASDNDGTIRHYLVEWAAERKGPIAAATAILDYFDREGR